MVNQIFFIVERQKLHDDVFQFDVEDELFLSCFRSGLVFLFFSLVFRESGLIVIFEMNQDFSFDFVDQRVVFLEVGGQNQVREKTGKILSIFIEVDHDRIVILNI